MAKFRIKFIPSIGYFAQVRKGFVFKKWRTIGRHNTGFGLYSEEHTDYPALFRSSAKTLIGDYKDYENKLKENDPIYEETP